MTKITETEVKIEKLVKELEGKFHELADSIGWWSTYENIDEVADREELFEHIDEGIEIFDGFKPELKYYTISDKKERIDAWDQLDVDRGWEFVADMPYDENDFETEEEYEKVCEFYDALRGHYADAHSLTEDCERIMRELDELEDELEEYRELLEEYPKALHDEEYYITDKESPMRKIEEMVIDQGKQPFFDDDIRMYGSIEVEGVEVELTFHYLSSDAIYAYRDTCNGDDGALDWEHMLDEIVVDDIYAEDDEEYDKIRKILEEKYQVVFE